MSSAQRRHCPPSTAWRPVGRSSLLRLNGSRANPPGGARTRCMQKRAPSRAHGRALPCRAAPGLGCSGTGYRCPDRPSRASWLRPVPPEHQRRLGRVAARTRPAQRRLPSSRRRRSGRVVGQTGCWLTPGRAQRCWRVGYGRTRVKARSSWRVARSEHFSSSLSGSAEAEQCAARCRSTGVRSGKYPAP